MQNTNNLDYKILTAILEENANLRFPMLKDILSKGLSPSRNTIEVQLTRLKAKGLVKTKGTKFSYFYYITTAGIDKIKLLEVLEERERILQYYNELFLGD
jgi:hypothetical protein